MFLRFQTKAVDARPGHPTGILAAAHELAESGKLTPADEIWLRDCLAYFTMHLKVPPGPREADGRRGISWFRGHSGMVVKIRQLAAFMENQGMLIETILTDDPGIICYEDSHQIVAKPVKSRKQTQSEEQGKPPVISPMLSRTVKRNVSAEALRKKRPT